MSEDERKGFCLTCGNIYSALGGGKVEGNGYTTSRRDTEFGKCGECNPRTVVLAVCEKPKHVFGENYEV